MKVNRKSPCPCGSGLPYMYCCIRNELRERPMFLNLITEKFDFSKNVWAFVDLKHDLLNMVATAELPIKYFCRENGLYFFSIGITIGQADDLYENLKKGLLTKETVVNTFIDNCKEDQIMSFLKHVCTEHELYGKREEHLTEAFKLHFEKRYIASVPLLFSQLEGISREYGGIENRDSFKPVIPTRVWAENSLYSIEDDAVNYNFFIGKLFEGGKDELTFNRNPVLHGFNITYASELHSLLLMYSILQIHFFKFWEKELFGNFKNNLKGYLMRETGNRPDLYIGAHFEKLGVKMDIFKF